MNLDNLKSQSLEDLRAQAKSLDISTPADMEASELLLSILRAHSASGGTISGSGTLEILSDGFGFLRGSKTDYTPSPQDIYVSPSQIRRFRLSTGDTIVGQVRPPRESERYFALLRVESVNTLSTDKSKLPATTPARAVHPSEKIVLGSDKDLSELKRARLWQLLCPVSKGQRILLFAPPQSDASSLLLELAKAANAESSSVSVFTLLVAQRPEVVSEYQDAEIGSLVSTTFDEPAARHTQMAEMVFESARRQADRGEDVLVLVDSLSRLAQAASQNAPSGMVNLPAGLNFKGVQLAKRIFASGRKIEDSGSITLIAVLRDSGETVDDYLRQELSQTANGIVRLSADAAAKGCLLPMSGPATNLDEKRFLNEQELKDLHGLRETITTSDSLLDMQETLSKSSSDREFLDSWLNSAGTK